MLSRSRRFIIVSALTLLVGGLFGGQSTEGAVLVSPAPGERVAGEGDLPALPQDVPGVLAARFEPLWSTVAAVLGRPPDEDKTRIADAVRPMDVWPDIVLHDLLPGEDVAVSTHPSLKWTPTVYGDRVVWADGRNGVGNRDIFVYDYALGIETQVTTDPNDQSAPAIDGDRIVYIDNRSGNQDIYMYDLSTDTETPITTNAVDQISPAIYGDLVAWMDYRNGTYPDVYMYDLSTGTESPVIEHEEYVSPSFSGGRYVSIYDDKIVWHDWRNGNADVFLYDVSEGTETQITDDPLDQGFPDIYGDIIVWEDNRNSPRPFNPDTEQKDIFMYDLSDGTESEVSTDPERLEKLPAIHGDRIVWTRNEDVMMYDLATDTESTIATGAGILSMPDIHSHRIVWTGPAPVEPSIRLLYVPLRWVRSQADFNTEVDRQVGLFTEAIRLNACPDMVSVTALNVVTQNFAAFTCNGDCGVGSIAPFVEGLGINHADYTAVVGLIDGTPCWPTRGCSSGGGHFIWADIVRPTTTAHELGHQFGLEDEYISNPAGASDCRANDGDMGPVDWWDDCDDVGDDGAATGDVNFLDADLGCDPEGVPCCNDPLLGNCGDGYPTVCCYGNRNAAGGRCIMSYANAPGPRAFGQNCVDHLATIPELNCPAGGWSVAQRAPTTTGQVVDVALRVHKDDTVEEQRFILRRGRASMDYDRGEGYRMAVFGAQDKLMWQDEFDLHFDYSGPVDANVDYSAIEYDAVGISRRILYHRDMQELRLYHGDEIIFVRPFLFCNLDGTCDKSETYLTCPGDCPLNELDGLCLPNEDGVCDPDCSLDVDPDCRLGPELIYIKPVSVALAVSETFKVAVRVDEVQNLYGVQIALSFDKDLVEVVDADPFTPGVQIEAGTFLNPDVETRNVASNDRGTIEYTASLQGEKTGASGSGALAWIEVHGLNTGTSPLEFTTVVLSDPQSVAIDVDRRDGEIIVRGGANAPFAVAGQVELERRASNAGAQVCAAGGCVNTDDAGGYTLADLRVGQELSVSHRSYLRSARTLTDPPETPGDTLTLPSVTLLGGDVDQNGHIFLNDGALVGMAMTVDPVAEEWYQIRDITDDGEVDIRDMVAVQYNWDARAPGPWPDALEAQGAETGQLGTPAERESQTLAGALREAARRLLGWSAAQNDVVVKIDPATATAEGMGIPIRLDIAVEDVEDLYAFAVKVRFDPDVLRVRDANPRAEGVQVIPGEFLDYENWVILRNGADNETGLAELAITQTGPTEGRDGSGVLGSIIFEGVAEGTTDVRLDEIQLLASDYPNTTPIPSTGQDGIVTIGGGGYLIFAPITKKGVE